MDIENKITNYLTEKTAYIRKGIWNNQGKKVNGQRKSKLYLGALNSDDTIDILTWKQYIALKIEDNINDFNSKEFISSMLAQIKNFGVKVDFNAFCRNENKTFEEKVDWLLKHGAKYTKTGIKSI